MDEFKKVGLMDGAGESEETHENANKYRLPFALCEQKGIAIQKGWTPRDAWEALKNAGHIGEVEKEYKEFYDNLKKDKTTDTQPDKQPQKEAAQNEAPKKETMYSVVQNNETHARIHKDKWKAVKPYSLKEVWVNPSKYGIGYYFTADVNGKRFFVSIDNKTANDRHWYDIQETKGGAFKINANGYLYLDDKGYARYAIKDLTEYEQLTHKYVYKE